LAFHTLARIFYNWS